MKTKYNQKNLISFILIAGALLIPAIFVFAQTDGSTISENETAALQDLSRLTGQQITSVIQAKEVCNLERFLTDCADIGKKNNLYEPEEIKQVNSILNELKGKIFEDFKNCADENCLLKVANQLAQGLTKNNPELAKQIDLTTKAVENKKEIITAAREAGVSFSDCQTMDPDAAPIELLRACAKLAKDSRVQKHISADKKQLAETAGSTVQLREALTRGDYQCGDGTLESCGNFCLKPMAEAKEKGISAIPLVCRDIANKFFGSDGIKQLETNYSQVNQAIDFYQKRDENMTFVTSDGRTLFNPEEISFYLETEAKNGNIEAIEKGTSFLVAQGLIKPEEKEFALKMTQTAKEQGGIPDFSVCVKDPKSCAKFMPQEERGQFDIKEKINNLMISEMNKEGVSDPRLCEDSRYNEGCLRASQRVLPQLEALAVNSPEAKTMLQGIKTQMGFSQSGFDAQTRAKKESEKFGGKFIIGSKEFQNFEEMNNYCRTDNSQECLAEAAKKGFIEKDFAATKFGRMYEQQFTVPEFNQQFFQPTSAVNFPQYQPQNQTGFPAGQQNTAFTTPVSNFGTTSNINKEEALKLFQNWLDNPQGQPPIPYFGNSQTPPSGQFQGYQQPPISSPYNYPYPQQTACSQSFPQPCPFGQYRQVSSGQNNCPNYGECISAPIYQPPVQTNPVPCPALPTVDSCPAGQTKEITFSSPECGNYYGCRNTNVGVQQICNSGQYWDGAACVNSTTTACTGGQYWNGASCVVNPSTSCASGQYWSGTACVSSTPTASSTNYSDCSENLKSLLGYDCHLMSNAYFDGPMTKYVLPNTSTVKDCSIEYINSCPAGATSQTCPNGQYWFVPLNGSGYCKPNETTATSCGSGQYWNGAACVSSTTTTCTGSQYWNGTACVDSPSSSCASDQYWNGTSCVTSTISTSANHTWTFKDGQTQSSSILGRTDSEYSNFISSIDAQCRLINKSQFFWKPNAGTNTAENWQNFGIPDCQGTTTQTTCASGQYWNGTACVTSPSTSCTSSQYWNGTACVSSTTTACTGSQYWNGTACVDSTSSCGSGQYWDGFTNTCVTNPSTSCASGQYWNGTACVSSTTTACTGSQYWNGTACVDSPSTSCASGQYWDGTACVSSTTTACTGSQYWNGTACVDSPSTTCSSGQYWNGTACVTSSLSLENQLAQIAATLRKILELSNFFR